MKVDNPSLEDSLLLVESKEAKKSNQVEEENQEKLKSNSDEKTDKVVDEKTSSDKSKDGE